jgi:hypothetical protein
VKLNTPAIVTTDLRLNEPRYASLPNIMKAKKKPLDTKTPGRLRRRYRSAPEGAQDRAAGRRKAGVKVAGVRALVGKLKEMPESLHEDACSGRARQCAHEGPTLAALTAAGKLGDVHVLVAGKGCGAVAEQVAKLAGIAKVLWPTMPRSSTAWPSRRALIVEADGKPMTRSSRPPPPPARTSRRASQPCST